jgi:hypothetical protein
MDPLADGEPTCSERALDLGFELGWSGSQGLAEGSPAWRDRPEEPGAHLVERAGALNRLAPHDLNFVGQLLAVDHEMNRADRTDIRRRA